MRSTALAIRSIACCTFAVALLGAFPATATALDVDRDELLELAERTEDDAALERLRDVDSVEGTPVDVRRILEGAGSAAAERRIRSLVSDLALGTSSEAPPAATAREQARAILRQDKYRATPVPRPFRGVLEAISDALRPVGDALAAFFDWVADLFDALADATPGGANTLWLTIGIAVVAAAILYTQRVVARRAAAGSRERLLEAAERGEDPKVLEREAAAAEERGDHELAVRLRFRAGLLRLDAARVIPARDSLTTGEVRRLLRSPTFDRIGSTFDEIAYGGRVARPEDSAESHSGWQRVMSEKAAR